MRYDETAGSKSGVSTLLTKLKKKIRARARHWYGLSLTAKSKGSDLTLCLRHPKTGQTATETMSIDIDDLGDVFRDEQALEEYADRIIVRFAFPVRPLGLIEND